MPGLLKKQPTCPYGNCAKLVCASKQCKKPGFVCEKGEQSLSQCWLFHQNCHKVKWSQVEVYAKENPLTKSSQFVLLQDKIQKLFLKALSKIHSEHEKFRMWTKTYGHNLQTMKFIKLLMDKSYQQFTGEYMASIIPNLSNKQARKIEPPVIVQTQLQSLKSDIDKVLEKISNCYLRNKKIEKTHSYSEYSNDNSSSKNYGYASNYKVSISTSVNNFPHNAKSSLQTSVTREFSTKQSLKEVLPSKQFRSKILDNLSSIQGFFEGRIIKGASLIYRASEHNFSIKKFHELCDNLSDTLTLIHNEFGKRIGGYTPVEWNSEKKHWVADKSLKSFIFSVDMNEKFNLNLAQFAIVCNPERGPTFGCCDICIVDNSNKQKSNCQFPISYNNNSKYIRNQNTSSQFTGHSKGQFFIKEWQVFRLQFE